MSDADLNRLADKIADRVASRLAGNKTFKAMCREFLLFLAVQEQQSRSDDFVASFFRLCEAKGIDLTLDANGCLEYLGDKPMGVYLQAIYVLEKDKIEKRLRDLQDRLQVADEQAQIQQELYRRRMAKNGSTTLYED